MHKGLTLFLGFIISFLSIGSSASTIAQTNGVKITAFYDVTDTLSIENIRQKVSNPIQYFKSINRFSRTGTYWLYLSPKDNNTWVLIFRKKIASIEVYPYPFTTPDTYGGLMVNNRLKALPGSDVTLDPGHKAFLVKIQVRTKSELPADEIKLVSAAQYQQRQRNDNFIQGLIQGALWLMILYSLLLYSRLKQKKYLFYVFYILFNSFFILSMVDYMEVYLFPDNYRLNLLFGTFQILGVFFYTIFLRLLFLEYCPLYTKTIDRRYFLPFCYFILVSSLVISPIIFYRLDLFYKIRGMLNMLDGVVAIFVFIYFRKGLGRFLRIIVAGSAAMIVGGILSVLDTLHSNPDILSYEAGLVIELILFTYSLGQQHVGLIEDKYEALLVHDRLKQALEEKNRELVYLAMRLSASNSPTGAIRSETDTPDQSFNSKPGESDNINLNDNSWKEFEKHFNETHPDFYRLLLERYPELTTNEIKLSALLKLNLNTKEIARITDRSPRSIEVMRSRIRQKMELTRDENLVQVLMRF
jgi:DNA-binding CsgD family transcriptional regulator